MRKRELQNGLLSCCQCNEAKPISDFYKCSRSHLGVKTKCKKCTEKTNSDAWHQLPSEKKKARARRYTSKTKDCNLRKKFGIGLEQYQSMLQSQGGVCAICKQPPQCKRLETVKALAVDHDHRTNELRGLLCDKCNMGIGLLNDDPERLSAALEYLNNFTKRVA